MHTTSKSLLVRADFALGEPGQGERIAYQRWRRILVEALPRLLGCADRCPRAEKVRLHLENDVAWFSGWLRIPIQRRPSRRRLRQFKAKLRNRLETSLLPIRGRLLKLGVRRMRAREAILAEPSLFDFLTPALVATGP